MSIPTAADVMSRDVHTLRESQTVRELLDHMRAHLLTGIPVVDGQGRALGLISQNDIARAVALVADLPGEGETRKTAGGLVDDALAAPSGRSPGLEHLLGRTVRDVMTPVVWSCRPGTPLAEVCDTMVQRRIHRVVVCGDDRKVLGMVSALDVVRLFRDQLAKQG